MADIYDKIGSGINKIQSSQNISQLRKIIQEASLKRTEILIQLGEEVYKRFRSQELDSIELKDQVSSLIELDQKIYQSQLAIAEFHAQSKEHACPNCSAPIMEGDRFCGGCGSKVEIPAYKPDTATKTCLTCKENIPEMAQFCSCCGIKLD